MRRTGTYNIPKIEDRNAPTAVSPILKSVSVSFICLSPLCTPLTPPTGMSRLPINCYPYNNCTVPLNVSDEYSVCVMPLVFIVHLWHFAELPKITLSISHLLAPG